MSQSGWFQPVRDPHREPVTWRERTGRRYEVRRWSGFWGRDMRVGVAGSEEEARQLADRTGGMMRDTSNGGLYMSKRYKRRVGWGAGGGGGVRTVPQVSDRPEMEYEPDEDWMEEW